MTGVEPLHIGYGQLLLALVLIVAAGAVSVVNKLGLEKDLGIGAIRTFVQLFIMGYALNLIFDLDMAVLVLGVYLFMITFAARIIRGRVKEREVPFMGTTFLTMVASYFVVSYIVVGVVVQADPWWTPRYFLPIGGMVVGNSMNALAVGLERLFSDLRGRRDEVEARLCLGADRVEASRFIVRDALKAGMIPSINSMMGVGMVFIPGMMTGQIVAGADPQQAVRYQIVVMLMIAASTSLSTFAAVHLACRRCFGPGDRLLLGPKR